MYAIEMDAEDHGLIKANAERFRVSNVIAVLGRAPEACDSLPDPDAVFIAGGGREVKRIAEAAFARLRPGGRLVVNAVSIDHVAELREALGSLPLPRGEGRGEGKTRGDVSSTVQVWMINLARGTEQLQRLSFEALKPNFLLAVTKG